MGGGGIGASLTYQTNANFAFNAIGGGIFSFDPLSNFSLGSGFDSALFQIVLNGNVFAKSVLQQSRFGGGVFLAKQPHRHFVGRRP